MKTIKYAGHKTSSKVATDKIKTNNKTVRKNIAAKMQEFKTKHRNK